MAYTQSTMSHTEAATGFALDTLIRSPFARLNALLADTPPGADPILFSLGEPHTSLPPFVQPVLEEHLAAFGKYPPIRGVLPLRQAICEWLERRYPVLDGVVDPETHILPLNGSREGLFSAIFPALARKPDVTDPVVLIPNPFYQVYAAAAAVAGAEPVFLKSGPETGFLPDLDAIDDELLDRIVALYLCSPSNPEGAVASPGYLEKAIRLARTHDFLVLADECYSEIYTVEPPPGALAVAQGATGHLANVLSFQSLSKRSGLPGLRSGFIAGDPAFLDAFGRFRNVACPQVPLPIQYVSAAAWADETHVEAARAFYQANFDVAEAVLQGRYGYARPEGGFFLWLNMADFGGGEGATKTLWKGCGVKVLPGTYLTKSQDGQADHGLDFVRLALVHDAETTREGLARLVATLG